MKTLQKHPPRIICVISCGLIRLSLHVQAIINCTVTPSMTFTKTSQKFGQWADSRANTVYGLGFATEQQLHQVQAPADTLAQVHLCCYCFITWNSLSLICPPVRWKSSPRSLRRWRMRLVWRERSLRTKSWPTRRSASLPLRWAPSFREGNMSVKVEQILQVWVKVFVTINAK